ncbi:hypothetical protein D3C81_1583930 [compost metagenome]
MWLITQVDAAFRGMAIDCPVLQLQPVGGLGDGAEALDLFDLPGCRNRQAHQRRPCGLVAAFDGRKASAILDMAALAGVGVE